MKIVDYLMIGATILIGREILCLPYAGFFLVCHTHVSKDLYQYIPASQTTPNTLL